MKIFASVQRTAQKCRWIGINFRWTKTKHAAKPSAAQIPKPSPPYNKTLYRGGANRRHRHWEMDTTRCLCSFHNPLEAPLHSKTGCRGSVRFVCHCFFIPTFAVFCLPLQFFTYLCLFLRVPDQKGVGHRTTLCLCSFAGLTSITLCTARSVIRLPDAFLVGYTMSEARFSGRVSGETSRQNTNT